MQLAISLSLIALFIPGLFLDAFHQNDVRLFGVPIGYLISIIVYTTYLTIFNAINIRKTFLLFICFVPFIFYGVARSGFSEFPTPGFIYMASWVINIFLFSMVCASGKLKMGGGRFFIVVVNIIFIATLLRYFLGGAYDTNPFSVFNRNASGFLIFCIFSLELLAFRSGHIGRVQHVIFLFLFAAVLLFFQSRSLPPAILLHVFILYRKSLILFCAKRSLASVSIALLSIMAFIFSPTGSRVIENIPLEVQFNQLPDNDNYDRDRIGLISSALYIIERNYIFGVGPGLENYLKEAEGSAFAHVRNARPHNFYLSALSDFGIIGSLFLLIGFYMAIRRLTLQGFSGHLSFLLPVGFLLIFNEYILLVDIWVLYPVFLIYLKLSKLKRPSGNEYHHHRPVGC